MDDLRKAFSTLGRSFGKSSTTAFYDAWRHMYNVYYDFNFDRYQILSQWISSTTGMKMYQLSVSTDVYKWLVEEHNQYGIKNPSWWKVNGKININETLFTLLTLKFAK